MILMYFLSIVKHQNSEQKDCKQYKKKLIHFSERIEKWHSKMQLQKKGTFVNDQDFVEIGNSPSRFETSEDE